MKLKSVIFVLVAAMAWVNTAAVAVQPVPIEVNQTYQSWADGAVLVAPSINKFRGDHTSSTFTDRLHFGIGGASDLKATLEVNSFMQSDYSLTLYKSTNGGASFESWVAGGEKNKDKNWSTALTGGKYELKVVGEVPSGKTAQYWGTLVIAAIPEPETYGMMLAGLGLLGFIAGRRKDETS